MVESVFLKLLSEHELEPENLASFCNLLTNLCYGGQNKIKSLVLKKMEIYIPEI